MLKSNKKLLIIAPYQFGELSDCYYWAKYAILEGWDVTYIGYKYKKREIKERFYPGVHIKSVLHLSNRILLGVIFYIRCIIEIILRNHQNIIICRMPHCDILPKLFRKRNITLDVRTLSVSNNESERKINDDKLREIKQHFKNCTVISNGVGEKIGKPYKILPLGAEEISQKNKNFQSLKLFYIGTFNNRNLHVFIEGLSMFQKKTGITCSFDIVGGGDVEAENLIENAIRNTGVKDIALHGYLTHDEAKEIFDECNIGVCYVPTTDYYQNQPPTKLYEYLLSGMACIATDTSANKDVMCKDFGIVTKDNSESISDGLFQLYQNRITYNSSHIVTLSQIYHWKHIVKDYLLILFN